MISFATILPNNRAHQQIITCKLVRSVQNTPKIKSELWFIYSSYYEAVKTKNLPMDPWVCCDSPPRASCRWTGPQCCSYHARVNTARSWNLQPHGSKPWTTITSCTTASPFHPRPPISWWSSYDEETQSAGAGLATRRHAGVESSSQRLQIMMS